jgi:hypothetical protein
MRADRSQADAPRADRADRADRAGQAGERPAARRWGLRLGLGATVAMVLCVPPAAVGLEPTARERLARIRAAGPDASLAEVLQSAGGAPNASFRYGPVSFRTAPGRASNDPLAAGAEALRPSRLEPGGAEVLRLHWDATPAPLQHGLILLGRRPELPGATGRWLIDCADRFWGTDSHTLALANPRGWKAVSVSSRDLDAFLDLHLPHARP